MKAYQITLSPQALQIVGNGLTALHREIDAVAMAVQEQVNEAQRVAEAAQKQSGDTQANAEKPSVLETGTAEPSFEEM